MSDRYEQMYDAAMRYYIQGETMDTIARGLGVSRSSVSRLLSQARARGLVRIELAEHSGSRSPVALKLSEHFGIEVHLVNVGEGARLNARFERVSRHAATLLNSVVADDQLVGVAWGVTMTHIARYVEPRPLTGVTIVQMNGSTNRFDSASPYVGAIMQSIGEKYGARVALFPVPAFFDYPDTKSAMWRERSIMRVLDLQRRLDVAIFGVGSLHGGVPSHVYTAGYLDSDELAVIERQGAVGDVCTVLLREDGSYNDIAFNDRATGLTPRELQKVPRRICVVPDPRRAPALLGALRAGVATDLVCDDMTARAVADRL
ncbi:sugar-binding transcriptional regulator [Nigerium massiliense]|uniref:sugar-binding transcriptional regulator n=1 Tax=Nigerium massiliense TaxID=1522317 RepID=UPI00058E45E2|nr:sugar-binding domain-containing protein [Nigerium massiliense]